MLAILELVNSLEALFVARFPFMLYPDLKWFKITLKISLNVNNLYYNQY